MPLWTVTAINGSAWAYSRSRAWRAFVVASCFALSTFAAVTLAPALAGSTPLATAALVFLGALVTMTTVSLLLARVPRRLTAIVGFLAFVSMFADIAFAAGPFMAYGERASLAKVAEAAAYLVILAALSVEFATFFLWCLFSSKRAYTSAVGRRPPLYKIGANLRRFIGMPDFVAELGRRTTTLTLAFLGVAIMDAWAPAAFVAGYLVLTGDRGLAVAQVWAGAAAVLFLANVLGVKTAIRTWAHHRAAAIYQDIRSWDARPPILFLRAFSQDKLAVRMRIFDPLIRSLGGQYLRPTVDELLLEAAAVYGPVIAIGDPEDPITPLGAARVFVANEGGTWRDVVTALAHAAQLIVICPRDTAGVMWELDLVAREELREKVIYLAGPDVSHEAVTRQFRQALGGVGEDFALGKGRVPLAAFWDTARDGWSALIADRRGAAVYAVALTRATQGVLGSNPRLSALRKVS